VRIAASFSGRDRDRNDRYFSQIRPTNRMFTNNNPDGAWCCRVQEHDSQVEQEQYLDSCPNKSNEYHRWKNHSKL
jgi:hypothetical protein